MLRHSIQNAPHPAACAPASVSIRPILSSSAPRLPIRPSTRQSRVRVPSSFISSTLGVGMMESSSSTADALKPLISHLRNSSERHYEPAFYAFMRPFLSAV
ncbi:hypothetical protein BDN70DRAFT_424082 [Pholiota conissans]|uniref:Uncharacterized protein n=1 Tax=Pholiota conissans TaxID=109636 RepID=A0A9P5YNA7_9AGAR|nr:hypothetical protein BDN70DRAFT_424082 [Pholiota conissans]